VAVVGIALDRLPSPAVTAIVIPAVTPAPVASAAIVTVAAAIVTAADIITGVTTVAAIIMAAVEGITLAGSIQEVSSLDMRPGPIIPSNILSRRDRMNQWRPSLIRGEIKGDFWLGGIAVIDLATSE
jgi:hypothetical protein